MTKAGMKQIEKMARAHNLKDFKWLDPKTIIPRHWVRDKMCLRLPALREEGLLPTGSSFSG